MPCPLPARTAGKVGVLPLAINAMFYLLRSRAFLSRLLPSNFLIADCCGTKKGNDNDLGKLRSASGAIFSALY